MLQLLVDGLVEDLDAISLSGVDSVVSDMLLHWVLLYTYILVWKVNV